MAQGIVMPKINSIGLQLALITLEFQVIALEFLIKQIFQPTGTPPFDATKFWRNGGVPAG